MDELREKIRAHWAPRSDLSRVRAMMAKRGIAPSELTLDDLAGIDQLHAGLLDGTRAFVDWARLEEGARVLDVGSGLGGPARCLALERGCRVTALELCPELDAAGRELTSWLGLEGSVEHRCGDLYCAGAALEGSWEVITLQHVDMHFDDKVEAYRRCSAALVDSSDSRILWHDWLAGSGGDLRLPVPWAAQGDSTTFLSSPDQFRADLDATGVTLTRYEPLVDDTTSWFSDSRDRLKRSLTRAPEARRGGLLKVLEEVEGILANVIEGRVIPFWGEARRHSP